jgi:SAM-dependent methyltransferase
MSHVARELLVASPILLALLVVGVDRYKRYRLYKNCLPHQQACEKMETWYAGLEDGWSAPVRDSKSVAQHLDNPLYGEITYEGMEALAKSMKFTGSDVFYDLGSGVGKLVTYFYLTTPIKKSVGVEMVGTRHQTAMLTLAKLQSEGFVVNERDLQFLHANLREVNFKDATVIYMSSLCFPKELMQELSQRFLALKPGLRIISSQPLTVHPRLRLVEQGFLPMSWTNISLTYYYELL